MSDSETQMGAVNRAQGAQKVFPQADYWVGIEGGIQEQDNDLMAFAWVFVLSKDKMGAQGTYLSQTPYFPSELSTLP